MPIGTRSALQKIRRSLAKTYMHNTKFLALGMILKIRISSQHTQLSFQSRLMMEVNYMLSYGAAEPSLSLLQRYNILGVLLPFNAANLAQQSNKQLSESSVMLMKLFSSLDQLVTCGRPSHDSLWKVLNFARKHSDAATIYAPEILGSQDSVSMLVQNSLDILTDKGSLQEAMSRFPGSYALVW
ncbi:hypothetical protein CQW23_12491 [Capsicum baccatum]|uniref:tRNA nucleotidyltransferase/poly(A) polymerase RNA and SrmB- binding domain-containing protein n=1 Tax=Capsicum baccatum TaxID=33114 RepID=A0A2G2WSS1_CAPBA|nr:hypothetical protein CQW23_12491 [Capsicum baccatum]